MSGLLSAEIAAALGRHKSVIEKRAGKDGWQYQEETTRGGKRRRYDLAGLPADIQAAVLLAQRPVLPAAAAKPTRSARDEAQIKALWTRYEQVPQHMKDTAQRRLTAL